jgi:hypothetical protein
MEFRHQGFHIHCKLRMNRLKGNGVATWVLQSKIAAKQNHIDTALTESYMVRVDGVFEGIT